MRDTQENNITKLNLDKVPSALSPDEAAYLLNHEIAVGGNRQSLGDSVPMAANYAFGSIDHPAGENYSVGRYRDEITNEVYSWIFNSNGVHYLQRVSDKNGLEVVYDGDCLELSADPQHSIEQFRAILRLDEVYNKNEGECKNRHGKQIIWTNGKHAIGCIDVEASIATNSFTTPFFDICPDPCAMVQLCVPEPRVPITATIIPRSNDDVDKNNRILNAGFKFRYRWVYYDLRASEWSDISTLYYIDDKGCFQLGDTLPRCWELEVPVGNPMVDKIEIAFSVGDKGSVSIADGLNDVWHLYDTIKKYNDDPLLKWYERSLSDEMISLDNDTCSIKYRFCNDKDCAAIDFKETSRVYNPLPIQPQGILRVKENNFGFYNYIQGSCPIDKNEINKINVNVNCPVDVCKEEFVEVKVRAVIVEVRGDTNQFVYRLNGVIGGQDDDTDPAYFGGGIINSLPVNFEKPYKNICRQQFSDARNFTAYIEGTDYFVEMKQMTAKVGFYEQREYGIISGMADTDRDSRLIPIRVQTNGGFFYQEATFKVRKGTRGIIRIKAHGVKGNDDSTSTTVIGTLPIVSFDSISTDAKSNWRSITNRSRKEILFDTCGITGNVLEIDESFVIASVNGYKLSLASLVDQDEYLYEGYITDKNNDPVTGALIKLGTTLGGNAIGTITDHNGYYFTYYQESLPNLDAIISDNSSINGSICVEYNCSEFYPIKPLVLTGLLNDSLQTDVLIEDQIYADKFFENINVTVLDCNGQPIKGIIVAMTEGKYKITDALTGVAIFKVRNSITRNKVIRAYVMDSNGCFDLSCNGGCNPCMPQTELIHLEPCLINNPTRFISTIERININIQINKTGLKRGGVYPIGIVLQGDCGKISSVYELNQKTIAIPKVQTTLNNTRCVLSYVDSGFTAPAGFHTLKIVRGLNSNPYELQWVIDKKEKTGDNKIKLTIQSLNDYNEGYFFKTNTVYQWVSGDRIEFIRDDIGNPISEATHGILNYLALSPFHDKLVSGRTDADANFFNQILIDDDGKIDFLKEGSVIEMQRSKECTTEPVYFQIASIPILPNGKLAYPTGTIDTFDTYTVKRVIKNRILQTFEHHSPSDFWGTKLSDVGKVFFKNEYEVEKRFGRNISINAVGQFNYFGDLVKTMPTTQQGDIIAASVSDGKIILAICENDNFLAMVADDLLRVGSDGVIRALSPDAIVGNPEAKLSGVYGCRYGDIGSIFFGDGFATWYDGRKYRHIKHDYQFAKAVDTNKAQTYFRNIGIKMDDVNKRVDSELDKIRFATGYNSLTGAVILTNKSLRHSGYNNDKKPCDSPNTTLLFNPATEDYLTFAGYTAEGYSELSLSDNAGCAFIAYHNGKPYIHPVIANKFDEFFGVATDRVLVLSINKYQQKERVPISFELQSDMMYFVSNVETSDPNFKSEIPPIKVKQFGKKWNAAFLRNINSKGGLFTGKEANDTWIKVTFVRDNTDQLKYGSIDNTKRTKFDSLGLILFRFQLSEQSGFPEQKG